MKQKIYDITRTGNEIRQLLSIRKFKAGYELKKELIMMEGNPPVTMTSAYTPDGLYIGNSRDAFRLCVKYGIKPEISKIGNRTCSIGYSKKRRKWYGWSHRGIHGFRTGDIVKEGDLTTSSGYTKEYINEHPESDLSLPIGFKAKTISDAKRMAIAFADSIS